jgi:hypothetical protein
MLDAGQFERSGVAYFMIEMLEVGKFHGDPTVPFADGVLSFASVSGGFSTWKRLGRPSQISYESDKIRLSLIVASSISSLSPHQQRYKTVPKNTC